MPSCPQAGGIISMPASNKLPQGVTRLAFPELLVEIEATAVVQQPSRVS
jgi:hypothetical protein